MRTPATAPALLALALALLVAIAGCSDGSAGRSEAPVASSPTTPTTPRGTPSATRAATAEAGVPPFPSDTLPQDTGWANGNGLAVTGVRTAQHPGYDRVVFDLDGTGTPGWRVEYTTSPTAEGSGDPVSIEGTAFLMIFLTGVGSSFDTGIAPAYDDATRLPGTGTEAITEISPGGGPWEGAQQAFIGLRGAERPFRVFALTHPTRVVIDVRHAA